MRPHKALDSEDAREAQWQAVRGAGYGAAKWGAAFAALGGLGYALSPVYRGLTIQFKVYIQMSGMVFGGMLEADFRVRQYENYIRFQRRLARDRAMWESYEKEFEDDDGPPLPRPSEPKK
ncbi:hypothetical protein F4780DRAFT_776557 [Xylariomycetidae sp. FL0641]|nr:hypothetical protein F4780DRAFT_776557 [Xylariomycetidae sp. FL0641]